MSRLDPSHAVPEGEGGGGGGVRFRRGPSPPRRGTGPPSSGSYSSSISPTAAAGNSTAAATTEPEACTHPDTSCSPFATEPGTSVPALPGWWRSLHSFPWWASLAVRAAQCAWVSTFFDPDEYWQGPEVAHWLVYGYGSLTWEWLPHTALRSFLHPLLYTGVYALLYQLNIDTPWAIAYSPRWVHVPLAVVFDYAVWRLGRSTGGPYVGRVALALSLSSWFLGYTLVRCYSNTLETVVAALAICFWPWGRFVPWKEWLGLGTASDRRAGSEVLPGTLPASSPLATPSYSSGPSPPPSSSSSSSLPSLEETDQSIMDATPRARPLLALFLAVLTCCIRPTNGILWVITVVVLAWRTLAVELVWRRTCTIGAAVQSLAALMTMALALGAVLVGATCAVDTSMYKLVASQLNIDPSVLPSDPVFVVVEFIKFNFLSSGADQYGTHPALWYFYAALPVVLGAVLLLFMWSLYEVVRWTQSPRDASRLRGLLLHRAEAVELRQFEVAVSFLSRGSGLGQVVIGKVVDMSAVVLGFIFAFSAIGHKEFRFLLPIVPLAVAVGAIAGTCVVERARWYIRRYGWWNIWAGICASVVLLNLGALVYLGGWHQAAPEAVMGVLRDSVAAGSLAPHSVVEFLAGCHQTPYHAFLHSEDVELRQLECPPEGSKMRELLFGDLDAREDDLFFASPAAFWSRRYGWASPEDGDSLSHEEAHPGERRYSELPTVIVVPSDVGCGGRECTPEETSFAQLLEREFGYTVAVRVPHVPFGSPLAFIMLERTPGLLTIAR